MEGVADIDMEVLVKCTVGEVPLHMFFGRESKSRWKVVTPEKVKNTVMMGDQKKVLKQVVDMEIGDERNYGMGGDCGHDGEFVHRLGKAAVRVKEWVKIVQQEGLEKKR